MAILESENPDFSPVYLLAVRSLAAARLCGDGVTKRTSSDSLSTYSKRTMSGRQPEFVQLPSYNYCIRLLIRVCSSGSSSFRHLTQRNARITAGFSTACTLYSAVVVMMLLRCYFLARVYIANAIISQRRRPPSYCIGEWHLYMRNIRVYVFGRPLDASRIIIAGMPTA